MTFNSLAEGLDICALVADLIVVDPVILANRINTIIASKICTTNGQMIHFYVLPELEDEVELGAVNQNKVMKASING